MAEWKSYRELSRTDIGTTTGEFTFDRINTGSLQRIADATELMAKNYRQLLEDAAYYKERYNESLQTRKTMLRRISALKGVITKLQRRIINGKR